MMLNKWKPSRTIGILYIEICSEKCGVSKNKEIYEYSQHNKTYSPVRIQEGNGFEICR